MPTHLFPMTIQTGDGTFTQARFYGTPELAEVWVLGAGGKPSVAATGAGFVKMARALGDRLTDGTRAKWRLELADGDVWLATPSGGCGCSHPLKRFDPAKAERV